MKYNFDEVIDRRSTDSTKWRCYDPDVLPLWVADMDFPSPEPVIRALHERVDQRLFGYAQDPPELREVIVERLKRLYSWHVAPESLVFIPGVVTGLNVACRALGSSGEGILMQTPIYPPMLHAPGNACCSCQTVDLVRQPDGRYVIDFDAFEAAISARTRLFLLCNPHNPVGRLFSEDELWRLAEICLRHDVVICCDEIHCDIVFSGQKHVPVASLGDDIARHTITLMAPSKTFNLPGLRCSFAIISDTDLRRRFVEARAGIVSGVNVLGYVAALAAYRDSQDWLDQLLSYLEGNRDFLFYYVRANLPGVSMARPEGTYLAWLDCRQARISDPAGFFLKKARVALNDGPSFGENGKGFARLNFACRRALLEEALERMKQVLRSL